MPIFDFFALCKGLRLHELETGGWKKETQQGAEAAIIVEDAKERATKLSKRSTEERT